MDTSGQHLLWPVVGQAHHRDSQRLNCCLSLLLAMTAGGSHPSAAMVSWFRTIMLPRNPNVLRVVHWKHRPRVIGCQILEDPSNEEFNDSQNKVYLVYLYHPLNHRFWMVLVHLLQRLLWAISWRPFYLGKSSPFFLGGRRKSSRFIHLGLAYAYIHT
jgi:hypothetical protein